MIKKGIVLAGGSGTRLRPLTIAINKQLLPIYDKPMIFYPISILMLSGIREILIITNPDDLNHYKEILGNGKNFGLKIVYEVQKKPAGLPEAFIIGEKFISNSPVALILGDNFFYGYSFSGMLNKLKKLKQGAQIFLHKVAHPNKYGVAKIKGKKVIKIIEKPKKFFSDLAITGLYFFDSNASAYAKSLKKSSRGEYEITDLIKIYLKKKKVRHEILGRGFTWLDNGSSEDLFRTSDFVSVIEKRQGFKVACLEEIGFRNKWISKKNLLARISYYGKCNYSEYLKNLIKYK
jgi:glucose-1-phosphate thymidylyltransferase